MHEDLFDDYTIEGGTGDYLEERWPEHKDGCKALRVGYSKRGRAQEARVYAESLEAADEISTALGVDVIYIRPEVYHGDM